MDIVPHLIAFVKSTKLTMLASPFLSAQNGVEYARTMVIKRVKRTFSFETCECGSIRDMKNDVVYDIRYIITS